MMGWMCSGLWRSLGTQTIVGFACDAAIMFVHELFLCMRERKVARCF